MNIDEIFKYYRTPHLRLAALLRFSSPQVFINYTRRMRELEFRWALYEYRRMKK